MAFVFTEAVQLGLPEEVPFLFERELVEMTNILERPRPELRGGLVDGARSELSWVVVCTIRPPLMVPTASTYSFHMRECSWSEGAARAIQLAMARLAHIYDYVFMGTRFELYGRRGGEEQPLPFP